MPAPEKKVKKSKRSEPHIGIGNKSAKSSTGFKGFKGLLKGNTKKKAKKTKFASDDASQQSTEVGSVKTTSNKRSEVTTAPPTPEQKHRNNVPDLRQEIELDPKASVSLSQATVNPSLEVILLLMDPSTRRFELLQLEFDSDKARVSDILAQIPLSVTEEAIRKQEYNGVCDKNARAQQEGTRLNEFCRGMDVLVAIPKGISVEECSRLARPILSDDKVLKMLKQTGVDITPWKKEVKAETSSLHKTRELSFSVKDPSAHVATKKKRQSQPVFPLIAICALVFFLLQAAHKRISAPILPGVAVPPGTWRSKCGLLNFLPSCVNAYFEVMEDGTVNFFDANQELAMKLKGSKCNRGTGTVDMGCVDGLLLHEDGHVTVGGQVVKSVVNYSDGMTIAPWPFVEAPKMKVRFSHGKFKIF